jgi:hypothetical protein
MPRPLSNPEYIAFQEDIGTRYMDLGLPPWGGIVRWEEANMDVLVFEGPGGLFLTDVSDVTPGLRADLGGPVYNEAAGLWYTHFPEELLGVIFERGVQLQTATEHAAASIQDVGRAVSNVGSSPWFYLVAAVAGIFLLAQLKK